MITVPIIILLVAIFLYYKLVIKYNQDAKNKQKAAAKAERERQDYTNYIFNELPSGRGYTERDYPDFVDTEIMR